MYQYSCKIEDVKCFIYTLYMVWGNIGLYWCPSCDVYKLLESMHYNLFII